MRLVEFLIALLEAHAQTLQRLAALFGEDLLIEMLEAAGDSPARQERVFKLDSSWFESEARGPHGITSPYAELEGAVREMPLAEVFQFHLWAYPHYRAFIESPLDLNSRVQGRQADAAIALVDEAVAQASAWLKTLPITTEFLVQAQSAAQVPWVRFRASVLKRVGHRPFGAVT